MEWVKLGDVAEITMGQSPDSSFYNESGDGLPFYQGVSDFGEVFPTPSKFTTKPKKTAQKGDILIGVRAPVGDINISKEDCCIGRGIAAIRPKNKKYSRDFLYFHLLSQNKYLNSQATGSTFKAISRSVLENVLVPKFTLEVQEKITCTIASARNLIAKRREQIDTLDELVKSLFIEISEQNEGELVKLKKVASIEANTVDNFVPFSEDYYLGVEDIEKETGNILKMVRVKDAEIKSSKNRFTREAILYSKIRPYLNKVALPNFDGLASTDVFPIMCGEKVNKYYLVNVLRSEKFVLYATLNSSGANIPRVNRKTVENYTFTLPPIALQNRFADYVISIEAQKESLRASLSELETLFDALMQAAFSGHLNQSL